MGCQRRYGPTNNRTHGGAIFQLGQVKGCASGNSHAADDNSRARRLVLDGGGCIGECTARTSIKARRRCVRERTSAEKKRSDLHGNHDVEI
jgi:hypothetical protein